MDELKEHEGRVAFEKKYVLRSDHDRDIRLTRRDTMISTSTFFIFIVPTIGAVIFWIAKSVGWL